MLAIALAAMSGLVWGVGDFAGGKATQRAGALAVAWVSKLVSLPLLALYLVLMYAPPELGSLAWGGFGGAAGMAGVILFYRALSAGAMTVVAPMTAVTSAIIPVIVGLARGEQTEGLRLLGVGCALAAITLVSLSRPRPGEVSLVTGRLVGLAVAAGVSFALFFVFLDLAGEAAGGAGLWPIVASQLAALALGALLIGVRGPGGWPRAGALRWTFIAGPFDMTANAIFLVATREGDLSIVAPLAALYPVTTVVLALIVDLERLRAVQVVGLLLALLALVLVNR